MIDFSDREQPGTSWPRRIFNPLAQIFVAVYLILDSVFRIVFRPVSRWLAQLRLIIRLEDIIASLPAYAVLALLILPFAVAEPAKIVAVYLMSAGHIEVGLALMIAAYFVSVLVVDRIFHAGKAKLLTIPWFAKFWTQVSKYKDKFLTWVKATAAWKRVGEIKQECRDMISKLRKRFV